MSNRFRHIINYSFNFFVIAVIAEAVEVVRLNLIKHFIISLIIIFILSIYTRIYIVIKMIYNNFQ